MPYVVVCGEPGGRLMDMIAHPRDVVDSNGTMRVNAKYYGDKVIAPAMQRLLGLVGADVGAWLREPAALTLGHAAADFAKRAAAPMAFGPHESAFAATARARTPAQTEHRPVFPERAVRGLRRAHRGAENRMRRVRFEPGRGGGGARLARGGAGARRRKIGARVPGVRRRRRRGLARGVRVQGLRRRRPRRPV